MWPPSGPFGPPLRPRTSAITAASTNAASRVATPAMIEATRATCGIVEPWATGVTGSAAGVTIGVVGRLVGVVAVVGVGLGCVARGCVCFLGAVELVGGGWVDVVGVLVDVADEVAVLVGGGVELLLGGGGGGAPRATAAPTPATGATAQSAIQLTIFLLLIPLLRRLGGAIANGFPLHEPSTPWAQVKGEDPSP